MLTYFINICLMGVYSLVCYVTKEKFKQYKFAYVFFTGLTTLQMVALIALRKVTVGIDTQSYVRRFDYVNRVDLSTALNYEVNEKGFTLLNRLIGRYTTDVRWLFVISAILMIIPVGIYIYKHSPMPFLSFMLYCSFPYYVFCFSGMRQGLAYALTLYSYKYIKEKKLIKFLILIIIAFYFHKSALVFLPAYFIGQMKLNKFVFILSGAIGAFIYAFRNLLAGFVAENMFETYEVMSSRTSEWSIMCIIIVLVGIILFDHVKKEEPDCDSIYCIMIIGAVLTLFQTVTSNGARIVDYYYMYVIIFIPKIVYALRENKIVVLGSYVIVILSLLLLYRNLSSNIFSVVPYKFFWQ